MLKIKKIAIKRFRSIGAIDLGINTDNNFITFCGENNVGKTNVLRAINLFFNPDLYIPKEDAPNHKYNGSRGGAVWPEIQIDFCEDYKIYSITRTFGKDKLLKSTGKMIEENNKRQIKELQDKDINDVLKKIEFFFIESINISLPQVINTLIDIVYDVEYGKSKFSGVKKELKESYEKYIEGLKEVLNALAEEINPMFKNYKEEWGVSFDIESNIKKFRELITADVEFYINDKSNQIIEGKGAGLQRLAYILLHFRLIEKIKNKSIILLVDEPDVYLHEGMQYKLLQDMQNILDCTQIFITTHSKVFINTISLDNVFLLDLKIEQQYYERKRRNFNILSTNLVNLDSEDGSKKIKNHLGIKDIYEDILEKYSIIVEGESDKIYLEELIKYFGFNSPQILVSNGANNVLNHLKFYEAFYKDSNKYGDKHSILVLLDNDSKGREVYPNLCSYSKRCNSIIVDVNFVPNFLGEKPEEPLNKNNMNWEIEDYMYPQVMAYLVNVILNKRGLKGIKGSIISKKVQQKSHKNNGILHLIEHEKNNQNPDNGDIICFTSSSQASETVKKSVANLFKLKANKKLAELVKRENEEYPYVKDFIRKIVNNK